MPRKSYVFANKELPSTGQLIRSTILAAATAAVLLVTVVMPAEYGIDPTGIGNLIGLKKMGEIRVSLAKEEAANRAKDLETNTQLKPDQVSSTVESTLQQTSGSSTANSTHQMEVVLAPDEGAEIKVEMSEGKKVQYDWFTDGGKVNFDVHADSKTLGIDYHQYGKGSSQGQQGILEAAFDGSHGWFWRNRTSGTIVITLKTEGEYTEISRKQ
jgi:hypothetical protein